MEFGKPLESDGNTIDEIKVKLNEFVDQSAITNFDGEDIIALIEEGESIDWVVGQLKSNSPNIDEAAVAKLLKELKSLVEPAESFGNKEFTLEGGVEPAESANESDLLDLPQLDLSQLVDALPPNVELPPGVDLKQLKSLMASPQGKIMSDFLLFCGEQGIDLNEGSLNDPRVQGLQDEWISTPRAAFDGKTPGEMLEDGRGMMPAKIETYRREEPRVGRNDPCPCGSGKKYKKCCGRA